MAREGIFRVVTEFKDYHLSGQSFRVPIRYRWLDGFFAIDPAVEEKVRI